MSAQVDQEGISKSDANQMATCSNDSFLQWLKNKRLEQFHDGLLEQGFEAIEDFQGLNETQAAQLCDELKITKIGFRNRFIRTILTISSNNEATPLRKSTDVINKLENELKELENIKNKCENDIKNDFKMVREAIDKREQMLLKETNDIYQSECKKLKTIIENMESASLLTLNENKLGRMIYNNTNAELIRIVENYASVNLIGGDITYDAPIIDQITQIDSTTINVKWQNTDKTLKNVKECEGKDNNDNKQLSYKLLPMINDNNNNNLIALNTIDINDINTLEYNVEISNDWETDYKIDLNNNDNNNNNNNISFECQIKIVDKSHSVESKWSNVEKIKLNSISREYNCNFTNLNGIGRLGPTKYNPYYYGFAHYNDVILDKNGMQIWTVPLNGYYSIIAYGAKGGDSENDHCNLSGGNGAMVGGIIKLNKNDKLKILIGQMGCDCVCEAAGGGGATFVIKMKNENEMIPLFIAAGGNGACNTREVDYHNNSCWKNNGIDGLAIECKTRNDDNYKYGGYISSGDGGRGGSYENDFDIFQSSNPQLHGGCFMDGAQGGWYGKEKPQYYGSDGGFGGGGAGGEREGGGGGGHIGGLVAQSNQYDSKFSNYGATSFNCCKNEKWKIMQSGTNSDHGKVEIIYKGQKVEMDQE